MNRAPTIVPVKIIGVNWVQWGEIGVFPDELSAMEGKSSTNCASARIKHYGLNSCLFVRFVVRFPGGSCGIGGGRRGWRWIFVVAGLWKNKWPLIA